MRRFLIFTLPLCRQALRNETPENLRKPCIATQSKREQDHSGVAMTAAYRLLSVPKSGSDQFALRRKTLCFMRNVKAEFSCWLAE
jgi:hypothetical protein